MIIYGKQAVIEALESGQATRLMLAKGLKAGTIKQFEELAKKQDLVVEFVPRIDLDKALKSTHHQGIAAEIPELEYADIDAPFELAEKRGEKPLLILLDQIMDPRNYGAIIRSAEVLGAHGVITEERRSAPLNALVAKTAAGATSYIPVVQVKNLTRYMDEIKNKGVWIYGASGYEGNLPEQIDWDRAAALVIGSEGSGMRRLVTEKCDDLVSIPMRGQIASLNASVAAGVLIYAVMRTRSQ